jgi:hypothetical protein
MLLHRAIFQENAVIITVFGFDRDNNVMASNNIADIIHFVDKCHQNGNSRHPVQEYYQWYNH